MDTKTYEEQTFEADEDILKKRYREIALAESIALAKIKKQKVRDELEQLN